MNLQLHTLMMMSAAGYQKRPSRGHPCDSNKSQQQVHADSSRVGPGTLCMKLSSITMQRRRCDVNEIDKNMYIQLISVLGQMVPTFQLEHAT
jgi:hypothetical protein